MRNRAPHLGNWKIIFADRTPNFHDQILTNVENNRFRANVDHQIKVTLYNSLVVFGSGNDLIIRELKFRELILRFARKFDGLKTQIPNYSSIMPRRTPMATACVLSEAFNFSMMCLI